MIETPATELDAVNVILNNMGEAPINSLSGELPLDALMAQEVLKEQSEETQTRGWFWNKEITTLAVSAGGTIPVPQNTLAVRRVNYGPYLTFRGGALYRIERGNNGAVFTDPQEVELTLYLAFDDLPPVARRYVTLKAARISQARKLGDELLMRQDSIEEQQAYSRMRGEDNANGRQSLKKAFDVAMITNRQGPVLVR